MAYTDKEFVIRRGIMNPASGAPEQAQPGSAATITIWDSSLNANALSQKTGVPFSRVVLAIFASHDSAALGVKFYLSQDGTNFNLDEDEAYVATDGETTYDWLMRAPHGRITYENSASTLTSWQTSLKAIIGDRDPGV